jgi:hypothetical protein
MCVDNSEVEVINMEIEQDATTISKCRHKQTSVQLEKKNNKHKKREPDAKHKVYKPNNKEIQKKGDKNLKLKQKNNPIFNPNKSPMELLNNYHHNLVFKYELLSEPPMPIYKCETKINQNTFVITGDSKKNAKKNCCYMALHALFPHSYKLPTHLKKYLKKRKLICKSEEKMDIESSEPSKQDQLFNTGN